MQREKTSAKEVLQKLKMEIRSSQNTLLIAVDIGKVKHCACFVTSLGIGLHKSHF